MRKFMFFRNWCRRPDTLPIQPYAFDVPKNKDLQAGTWIQVWIPITHFQYPLSGADTPIMDTSYLQQKRRGWYIQMWVPKHLVPIIGKRLLCRSLKTRDIAEAVRRKHTVLAEFHGQLRRSECKPSTAASAFEQELAYGLSLLDKIRAGDMYPEYT
jgi:hypothetical protein